jgi:multiple sugar transport system permease protein
MTHRAPHFALRLIAHTAVYAAAATMLLPFLWMVATSLKSDEEALGGGIAFLPTAWKWTNYAEAARAANLGRYYVNSTTVAVLTTLLAVVYNALAGYAFAKLRFRGRRLLLGATLATMMLPPAVFFVFSYVICARLGLIDNPQALIVPFLASGFGVFYMKQAIEGVPDTLLEAGRLDGMTELDLFWMIVRPAIGPALAALAVISFVNSWNAFFWPLIVIDSDRMKTLPLALADLAAGQYVQSWPVRMAAATILTLPPVLVFAACQRAFVRGVAMTGTKE